MIPQNSKAPKLAFFDSNGAPLSGGLLFTYEAGTVDTKQTTYTDATGGTANANPIVLDSRGECDCWLDPTLSYKFTLSPSTDTDPPTNPIWTVDNLSAASGVASSFAYVVSPAFAANAYSGTTSTVMLAYTANQVILLTPPASNTGPATLNLNGLGAKNIYYNGAAMVGGEIQSGAPTLLEYDGTQFNIIASGGVVLQGLATAKGDLLAAKGVADLLRLAVGSDGQVLTANSGSASGLQWNGQLEACQGRLEYVSGTQIQLTRSAGAYIYIGGTYYTIPSGGIQVSNAGLAANTTYYVYCKQTAGVLSLYVSGTTYAISATSGILVASGTSDTLVGMVRTTASAVFADNPAQRFVLSYYRRRTRDLLQAIGTASTSSTSPVQLSSVVCDFLSWGDEATSLSTEGQTYNNTGGYSCYTAIYVDGTPQGATSGVYSPAASAVGPISNNVTVTFSEGYHSFSLWGNVNGNTGTWAPIVISGGIRG